MKVSTFLNKLMMSSTLETVRIEKNGYTKAEYDEADLRLKDYGFWGNETVKTFRITDNYYGVTLVVNI